MFVDINNTSNAQGHSAERYGKDCRLDYARQFGEQGYASDYDGCANCHGDEIPDFIVFGREELVSHGRSEEEPN